MTVAQIYGIMNNVTKEILGETAVLQEDLSNIVDIGTAIFDATTVDNYVKGLMNQVGRVVFVNRPYVGRVPSVLMDSWEYGSVVMKVRADLPEATENESWELENGQSYDPNIFYKPAVHAKFFNKKVTFEVPLSFAEMQVKESLQSAEQLNGFLSMLYNAMDKAMQIKLDALVMRTINNFIGQTINDDQSGIRAVNLLSLYNATRDQADQIATKEAAIATPEFLRFASYLLGLYVDRLASISTLFNAGGTEKQTPADRLHTVLLSEFKQAAGVYLYDAANQFNVSNIRLPEAETVAYWQGSGTDYSFDSTSKIHVKTADGDEVEQDGIVAVMFDRDALGVTNMNRRTTSNYNPKAEFYTNWAKMDAGYFNDFDENFIVFYIGEE